MKKISDLMDFGKSPVLKAAYEALDHFADTLNEKYRITPVSLDSFVSRFSTHTDDLIRGFEREESLSFLGGHVVVRSSKESGAFFRLELAVYFQDSQGCAILKEVSRTIPLSVIDSESQADLRHAQEIKFEVLEPKRG